LTKLDIFTSTTYDKGMKTFLRVLLAGVVFTASLGISRADSNYSFSFSLAQKKGGGTKTETYYETTKNQKWSYLVTMENKSFKDVADIQIKYVVFSKQIGYNTTVTIGGRNSGGLMRHEGTTTIKMLKNNDKVTFSTDGVMLTSIDYDDGYGEESLAKGALKGLWLRVYVDGQMVAEYTDPTDLPNKATFDPPPKN
jgi:hypothetical protein